jgi:hypothetical protein
MGECVRCSAVRCGAVRCGAVRCGAVWCGAVRCGAVRCGAVRCGAVRARLENRIPEHLARERRGLVLAELLVGVWQRQRGGVHAPVLAAGELQQEEN